jgi:exodeoxyribonuclease X
MLIRCIDFETTGTSTDADKHCICEVGWCDVLLRPADRPEVGQPHSLLVDPGRSIDPEARAVHHITDAELRGRPAPAYGLSCMALEGTADGKKVDFFAAHHADGDREHFEAGGIPWICSWKAALRIAADAPRHGLQVLRYYLDLPCDNALALPAHRAGPDAYVLAHLMAHLIEMGGVVDDMVRWSTGPALLPRFTFGMYRGEKWDVAPDSYLTWIIDESDLDRDVKANARYHLRKREQERATAHKAATAEAGNVQ